MDEIAQHGIEKVQILSPFKSRGDTCVKNLNDRLREIINPLSPALAEMKVGTRIYRTGDRVLQTRNIDEISNGDVGFIRQITKEEDDTCSALIEFGDRSRTYSQDEMDMIELAYAMTIHKSQGSEYSTVIIPMMASHYIMFRRNLIYTAITRAKKKVILVGEKKAIYTAEELSVMTFLESCGTCKRCGSPLFPSFLKKDGYTYQCFTCDEDFYAFEQND